MNANSFESRFSTRTGWLCLDFANTVDWHASSHPEETLSTYSDVVKWAERVSIVSADGAKDLLAAGEEDQDLSKSVLNRAIELREAIYRILSTTANGIEASLDDMSALNMAIANSMANARLEKHDRGFEWNWTISAKHLDSVLWPVVWSAAGLLTSEAIGRVGQCADEKGCGWLFWDTSRNRTRRWCDMKDCGNRAKSRRHYRRSRIEG